MGLVLCCSDMDGEIVVEEAVVDVTGTVKGLVQRVAGCDEVVEKLATIVVIGEV